jgi:hypothetical protein
MEIKIAMSILGLSLTGLGALISVYGLLSTRNKDLFLQCCTLCGYNSKIFKSIIDQKYFSYFGFLYILIGTALQIVSVLIDIKFQITNLFLTAPVILVITLFFATKYFISKVSKKQLGQIKIYYEELTKK